MDLFSEDIDPEKNLLPLDGEVHHLGILHGLNENVFSKLLEEIAWENEIVKIFGKTIESKRRTALYCDEGISYTYSGVTKRTQTWTPVLEEIKTKIETICGQRFNSCLLNLYSNGEEGMGWHSDNESELGTQAFIASLSLGCERKFSFRHKVKKIKVELQLQDGSLIIMKGNTQQNWQHALLKSKKIKSPRINLSFRHIKSAQN